MPINLKDYHPEWKQISKAIRARAMGKCELCDAAEKWPHPRTGSKVVLTVHHINFDKNDNHPLNLIALCQRCHLRLDIREKIRKRAGNKNKKATRP